MMSEFEIQIENYSFNQKCIEDIKNKSKHSNDWPVVYILYGNKEAYIGETQDATNRMRQHYSNRNKTRKHLTKINLIQSDSFNKSAILDIENKLINYMHADGKFSLQNSNGGQSKFHNYYQRSKYQNLFEKIWEELKNDNIVKHELFEIENTELFKFSPYKQLTDKQYDIVKNLVNIYSSSIRGDSRVDVIVNGGAGTGKSLIAITFLNIIANILFNNFDSSSIDDLNEDDSILNISNLINSIKEFGNNKIAFVIPVPSFKNTVKKVFKSVKQLKSIDVISPTEATKKDYDVLIVDEAHRLKRRNKLVNYGAYDTVNYNLGLEKESTELDWLKLKAKKLLILFYDKAQSVKESDVNKEDYENMIQNGNSKLMSLESQLRVKGGNEYIEFVNQLFSDLPVKYKIKNGYDFKVFDDCNKMVEEIKEKNSEYKGLCRVLSGLSFSWRKKVRDKASVKYSQNFDFEIDGHHYKWNDDYNASDFITNDKNVERIGCIYTCQGYDLNYAGVIFGNEICYNEKNKKIEYHTKNFTDTNSKSKDVCDTISNIINAYSVLLTRGVYGTYIYAVDKPLREYIKKLIA